MENYILNEMIELGADGVEFVPIFCDYSKPYTVILDISLDKAKITTTYPKSARRYYKLIDGKKHYLDESIDEKVDKLCNKENTEVMVNNKSWEEFRSSGMLWWINMILHTFGWAITIEYNDAGNIKSVCPARVKYRGFDENNNTEGYIKVSNYMKENADKLLKESME